MTPDGVRPNPDKIIAIKNFPIPSTTRQIKSSLGLLGYYRKFVHNFAHVTKPMAKLLKKRRENQVLDPQYINCFEICKTLLTNEPLLQYPDLSKDFNITSDSSNYAIGAVTRTNRSGQTNCIRE